MASREEVSSLGEVNGVRSRVDQEDYDAPENNNRRPAVVTTDGGLSPDALDYEATDDDGTLSQAADDERFLTSTTATGAAPMGRADVAYDRAAAQATVYESNVGKVPDHEKDTSASSAAPAKDVEGGDEIEATKAEIEHTRAELSETIDAIKEKLSPAHIAHEAKEATVGKAQDAVHNVVESVKDKAASVFGVVRDKAAGVADAAKDKAAIAVDAAKGAGQMISDKVSQARSNNDGGTGVNATSGNAPVAAVPGANPSITYYDRTSFPAGPSGGSNLGATIVDTIKVNPLPAAIAGFGLGWLLLSIQRHKHDSDTVVRGGSFRPDADYGRDYAVPDLTPRVYTGDTYATAPNIPTSTYATGGIETGNGSAAALKDKAANLASGVAGKASDLAHNVGDKASGIASTAADKASGLASTVTGTASNVASTVSSKASDLAHAASDKASDLKDKASSLAVGAKDKASDLAHSVGDKASDLKETTKVQYRAASDSVGTFVHEQPLVAGALALLAGAAIGYLLPGTEKENRLIGPKRDQLMEKAGDAVQNVAHKVQTVAETALGQAKESLSETVEVAKDQLQHAVEETKQSVKNEVKGQGLDSPATAVS